MKIQKTRCDQCKRERDDFQIGGYPMIEVKFPHFVSGVGTELNGTKHFCNEQCLLQFLQLHIKPSIPNAL